MGREGAIAELKTLADRGTKVIVIQARGGVGKTTLARKYLQQEFETFLEFPIAKETKDIASVESLIEEKLRQLGEEPGREFLVSIDRLKRKLQSERIGILIDNLEPALDSAGKLIEAHRRYVELLRVLADPTVQSVTLITTRERLRETSITVQHYLLRSLDVAAWETYFQSRNIATAGSALPALHNAYGGNAKAMDILSGAIVEDFSGDIAEYWQVNQDDLLIERDLEDLVTAQFNRIQELDRNAYNLLCRMGCYRYQDVPRVPIEGLLCLLWDVAEGQRRRVVKALQDRSLVDCESGEYWLHPVIRGEAIGRLRVGENWEGANRKAAEFWLGIVQTITTLDDALKTFESYFHCLEIFDFDAACGVMLKRKKSRWEWYNLDGGESVVNANRRLGLIQKTTLAVKQLIDNNHNQYSLGYLYLSLAQCHLAEGNLHKSIEAAMKAIEVTDILLQDERRINIGNDEHNLSLNRLKLASLVTKAVSYLELLEIEKSEAIFDEILEISENLNQENFAIEATFNLAFIYSSEGLSSKAIDFANKAALKLKNETFLSSEWCRGHGFLFLGLTYKNLGETHKALEMCEYAIHFAETASYTQIKARALTSLAELHRKQQNYQPAFSKHAQAVEILEGIGAKCDLAEARYQLGLTYQAMGEIEKSNENFQQAIRLFTEMEAPKQVERVRRSLEN